MSSQAAMRDTGRVPGRTTPSIRVSRIDAAAGSVFCLLLLLSLCGSVLTYSSENAALHQIAELLLFEEESNLPTFFNFLLLVANMAALMIAALLAFGGRDRWRWHWLFLGLLFLALAYDEAAQIHERLSPIMASVMDASGFLAFAWVVPGIAVVLVVGLAFSPFLLALPRRSAILFLLAGSLYVGGALGAEMIGANHWSRHGWDNVTYSLISTVEEALEMIGLMVLLHATMSILAGPGGAVRFEVHRAEGVDS